MKPILFITMKDILQNLRERTSLLFLLIMPAAFTLLFGLAFGGAGGSSPAPAPALGFLDQDGSRLSQGLKEQLRTSTAVALQEQAELSGASLEGLVAEKKLAVAVIIPAGYGAALQAGQQARLVIYSSSRGESQAAQGVLLAAAGRLVSAAAGARLAASAGGGSFDSLAAEAVAAWNPAPIRLVVSTLPAAATEKPAAGGMTPAQASPGMMLQFGIAGLLAAAQVLVRERKTRCLQRLLTTATARWQILLGHFLAIFSVTLVQFLILIIFGQVVFGLGYLAQLLATLLMAVASALFIGALGLLIGTLAKSDEQAILFALMPMFVFAGLGGAWMPLDMTGPTFQAVGHLTPVAWAMDGFKSILAGGQGLGPVALPAAVLLGYAALFFGLAVAKFRSE